jgi:hypothetical protein
MHIRRLAILLPALLAACGERLSSEDRRIYDVTTSRVSQAGVELAIESCELWHCDFVYEITNHSDSCIAFHATRLPSGSEVWFEDTLGVPRQIARYPSDWARHSFIVLGPGESVRKGVSVRRITGRNDIETLTPRLTTEFVRCEALTGAGSAPTPLVSEQIRFTLRS